MQSVGPSLVPQGRARVFAHAEGRDQDAGIVNPPPSLANDSVILPHMPRSKIGLNRTLRLEYPLQAATKKWLPTRIHWDFSKIFRGGTLRIEMLIFLWFYR